MRILKALSLLAIPLLFSCGPKAEKESKDQKAEKEEMKIELNDPHTFSKPNELP